MAQAEVERLARAPEQVEASLHAALRIDRDRHATPLAGQAAAALAGPTDHPSAQADISRDQKRMI